MKQYEPMSDAALEHLLRAIRRPQVIWSGLPACTECGRHLATGDCEPDPSLCWRDVTGSCERPSPWEAGGAGPAIPALSSGSR